MCGIIGYAGPRQAMPIVIDGLVRLEYRGYDSAGIAVIGSDQGVIQVQKCEGRLSKLIDRIEAPIAGRVGMGHTRWATHGPPSDHNSHPHQDCSGAVAIVHNGIIENYLEIKGELLAAGHAFTSETDTEVAAHLIEQYLQDGRDAGDPGGLEALAAATRRAARRLRGAYALAVIWRKAPDGLVAVRNDSPLILGAGEGENYLASDVPALLPHTRRMAIMENGDLAVIRPDRISLYDEAGQPKELLLQEIDLEPETAELGGYRHFMEKEIFEQPAALRSALRGRLPAGLRAADGANGVLGEALLPAVAEVLGDASQLLQVYLIACGTAYHAGMIGKDLIERLAGVPAMAEVASEFRYRNPLIGAGHLVVAISQSGETSDTLGALREAQRLGARTLGVVNVVGSSVAREVERVLSTRAGIEIAVASTKAYTTQIAVLTLLALELARLRGTVGEDQLAVALPAIARLPDQAAAALETSAAIEAYSAVVAAHRDAFFIGRGLDYAVCLEGQLKLKEISYLHAEACPAGELKHGTLALIVEDVPVIAVVTQPALAAKTISNIQEVRARGGDVTAVVREDLVEAVSPHAQRVIPVPATEDWLQPLLAAIPLQLLAYHVARIRGCDVDKPRNLAKSVTVE